MSLMHFCCSRCQVGVIIGSDGCRTNSIREHRFLLEVSDELLGSH